MNGILLNLKKTTTDTGTTDMYNERPQNAAAEIHYTVQHNIINSLAVCYIYIL